MYSWYVSVLKGSLAICWNNICDASCVSGERNRKNEKKNQNRDVAASSGCT